MSQTEITAPRSTGPVNTSQGWGIASAVVGLAIGFAAFAWYYHNQTYRHPTDPTWIQDADRKSAAHNSAGH
jgi:hypothetical protein